MEYGGFSLCEGVSGHSHFQALRHQLELVDVADEGGMDAWFFPEHHCNPVYSLSPSPNLITAVASQRTRRIRLGSMVTVVPFHHPLRAAEEIRLLDALTGGRLEVGLGRGGIRYETAAFGMGHTDSQEVFTVGIELLLRFLTEGSVDYDTPFWTGTGAVVVPEATQRPHPPIWFAAASDRTIEKAAELGAHCMTGLSYTGLLGKQIRLYREAWAHHQNRKPPGRFGLLVLTVVGRPLGTPNEWASSSCRPRWASSCPVSAKYVRGRNSNRARSRDFASSSTYRSSRSNSSSTKE